MIFKNINHSVIVCSISCTTLKYTEQRYYLFHVLFIFTHVEITHIAQEHIEHLNAQEHRVHRKYIEHIITYTLRSRVFRALFIITHIAH